MNTWSMMNLQDANSPIMEHLMFFHDYSLMILLIIMTMIFYIILNLMMNKLNNKYILQNNLLEIIWTIMPMLILMMMAIPSLKILYLTDEIFKPMITIKSIGHQWYWSFELTDFKKINFNSFMIPSNNLKNNYFRLLEVDNHLVIPMNSQIRMLITSADVIHSWTIPCIGIKIDAIPGRINQTSMSLNRPGLYFGQCSEICGLNHSFMPIVLESTNFNYFIKWINMNN